MGISEGVFGPVETFPDITSESEQRDLPSVNFDKPAKEVPLYRIADAGGLVREVYILVHGI